MEGRGAGFANVLDRCLAVAPGERVVLLTDVGTDAEVVSGLSDGVSERGATPVLVTMPVPPLPGSEPPPTVAAEMLRADAAIELTSLFVGSSRARQRGSECSPSRRGSWGSPSTASLCGSGCRRPV